MKTCEPDVHQRFGEIRMAYIQQRGTFWRAEVRRKGVNQRAKMTTLECAIIRTFWPEQPGVICMETRGRDANFLRLRGHLCFPEKLWVRRFREHSLTPLAADPALGWLITAKVSASGRCDL
ncbi:MAG: hypothetical protein M0Z78_00240 [Betaproteobacteria bacterium]|nr:hypothetical protein [Betaproteobacteria bacterium]